MITHDFRDTSQLRRAFESRPRWSPLGYGRIIWPYELDEPILSSSQSEEEHCLEIFARLSRCEPIPQRIRLWDPASNPRQYLTISPRLLRPVPVPVVSSHKKCLVP